MSLLLDALDRAERSRREQRALAHPEPTLEPRDGEGVRARSGAGDGSALFELAPGRALRGRSPRTLGLVALLLAALAVVAWLYLSLLAPAGTQMAAPAPAVLAPGDHRPDAGVPPVNPGPLAGAQARSAPVQASSAVAAGAAHTVAAAPAGPTRRRGTTERPNPVATTESGSNAGEHPKAPPGPAAPAAAGQGAVGSVSTAPSVDIHLFRSVPSSTPDPALLAAWTALRDGRLEEAQQAYLRLEQQLPTNADVELGLGRLAAERGQTDEARRHYQRAQLLDPRNPAAQAGLAMLQPAAGNAAVDSQLRQLAAGSDGDAQFALAARLSASGQWPEAEQAWFEALRSRPEDPDLLYNLAVALDHLGQGRAAGEHYRQALQAARSRPAHFSQPQVEQRLQALAGG